MQKEKNYNFEKCCPVQLDHLNGVPPAQLAVEHAGIKILEVKSKIVHKYFALVEVVRENFQRPN